MADSFVPPVAWQEFKEQQESHHRNKLERLMSRGPGAKERLREGRMSLQQMYCCDKSVAAQQSFDNQMKSRHAHFLGSDKHWATHSDVILNVYNSDVEGYTGQFLDEGSALRESDLVAKAPKWAIFTAGAPGAGKSTTLKSVMSDADVFANARKILPSEYAPVAYDIQQAQKIMINMDDFRYELSSWKTMQENINAETKDWNKLLQTEFPEDCKDWLEKDGLDLCDSDDESENDDQRLKMARNRRMAQRTNAMCMLTQAEAGYLSEVVMQACVRKGLNFIYDSTLGNVHFWTWVFKWLNAQGYRIGIVFVNSTYETTRIRADSREKTECRGTPDDVLRAKMAEVPRTINALWEAGVLSSVVEYMNEGIPQRPREPFALALEFPDQHEISCRSGFFPWNSGVPACGAGGRWRLSGPTILEQNYTVGKYNCRCLIAWLPVWMNLWFVLVGWEAGHFHYTLVHAGGFLLALCVGLMEIPYFRYDPRRLATLPACFPSLGKIQGWMYHHCRWVTTTRGRGFLCWVQSVLLYTNNSEFTFFCAVAMFWLGTLYLYDFSCAELFKFVDLDEFNSDHDIFVKHKWITPCNLMLERDSFKLALALLHRNLPVRTRAVSGPATCISWWTTASLLLLQLAAPFLAYDLMRRNPGSSHVPGQAYCFSVPIGMLLTTAEFTTTRYSVLPFWLQDGMEGPRIFFGCVHVGDSKLLFKVWLTISFIQSTVAHQTMLGNIAVVVSLWRQAQAWSLELVFACISYCAMTSLYASSLLKTTQIAGFERFLDKFAHNKIMDVQTTKHEYVDYNICSLKMAKELCISKPVRDLEGRDVRRSGEEANYPTLWSRLARDEVVMNHGRALAMHCMACRFNIISGMVFSYLKPIIKKGQPAGHDPNQKLKNHMDERTDKLVYVSLLNTSLMFWVMVSHQGYNVQVIIAFADIACNIIYPEIQFLCFMAEIGSLKTGLWHNKKYACALSAFAVLLLRILFLGLA